MPRRGIGRPDPRRALAAAAGILATSLEMSEPEAREKPRLRGTLEDLLALREHSDLNVLFVPKRPWFTRSSRLGSWRVE